MLDVVQRVQRADAGQSDKLLAVQRGNAQREIVDGCEGAAELRAREKRFADDWRRPFA